MNMQILYALERLRTPLLDGFLGAVTEIGNETIFMAAAIILYWCFNKKWGYYLLCVGFFGTLINQFVKILCRIPRPWVRYPGFSIVENARAAATGYSFPSGHTAGIVSLGGCIARITKAKWLRAVCIVLIALVAFSRIYLGVHYPTDVLFSLVVGIVLVYVAYPIFDQADKKPERVYFVIGALALLTLAYTLFVELHAFPADTDAENLTSAAKNGWTLLGSSVGMLLSLWLERRYVNFDVKACWWAQLIKTVVGLALVLAIRTGLKPVLASVFGGAQFAHAIRYFCVVVFGAYVWPLTFKWFSKLEKKK